MKRAPQIEIITRAYSHRADMPRRRRIISAELLLAGRPVARLRRNLAPWRGEVAKARPLTINASLMVNGGKRIASHPKRRGMLRYVGEASRAADIAGASRRNEVAERRPEIVAASSMVMASHLERGKIEKCTL